MIALSRRSFLKMMAASGSGLLLNLRFPPSIIAVPPSVMLHARQDHLDNLAALVDWLLARDYTPISYRMLWDSLVAGAALPRSPVILSIDDLTLVQRSNNFAFIEKMVNILIAKQVPGVLAINTEPVVSGTEGQMVQLTEQDDGLWATARAWTEQGIELATHTQSHRNLLDASLTVENYQYEIGESAQMIAYRTGQPVIALVLPYGNGTVGGQQDAPLLPRILDECRRVGIGMVVGVAGGRVPLIPAHSAAQPVYFVGRVGPVKDRFDTIYGDIDYWHRQNTPGQASDLP